VGLPASDKNVATLLQALGLPHNGSPLHDRSLLLVAIAVHAAAADAAQDARDDEDDCRNHDNAEGGHETPNRLTDLSAKVNRPQFRSARDSVVTEFWDQTIVMDTEVRRLPQWRIRFLRPARLLM